MEVVGYKGISFPFRIGQKGGVVMSGTSDMEIQHIIESIKQILLTRKGERVNEPEFGADLYNVIFENLDETLLNVLTFKIQDALQRWEPRIEVDDVYIIEQEGGVDVVVEFTVVKTLFKTATSVYFDRRAS